MLTILQCHTHPRYGRTEQHTRVYQGSLGQDGVGRIEEVSELYKVGGWLYCSMHSKLIKSAALILNICISYPSLRHASKLSAREWLLNPG
jgi:hypothetical protein